MIAAVAPDIVIGEQAPCALLAARSLNIPVVALGTTYTLPPTGLEAFPILLEEHQERIWLEAAICEVINTVMTPLGLPPLKRLAEIYRADASLPVGIRLLDPYVDARSEPRIAPDVGGIPAGGDACERQEVFVYLSTTDRSDPAMLDFLQQLKVPTRLYIANADAATLARFRATGAMVEERPVPPSDIARRSRVLVHAGNHGTMCLGIRAGIPQLSVPQQLEQMFNARRLERAGCGRTIGWSGRTGEVYTHHVLDLYEDPDTDAQARCLAEATAADFAGDARAQSVSRILEVIT
jgi:hypothetical protein